MLFQFGGYIENWTKKAFEGHGALFVAGYYIGFNICLIVSFILFVISGNIKRKLDKIKRIDKIELNKIIDSIGKSDVKKEITLFAYAWFCSRKLDIMPATK